MRESRTPILATLLVGHPDGSEQIVSLKNGDSISVGRDPECDIVVDEAAVSREHAHFDCSSFGVVVTDLSSLNGTFLNGSRLTSMKDLNSGDIVNIGSAKFKLALRSEQALQSRSSGKTTRAKTAKLKPVHVTVLVSSVRELKDWKVFVSLPEHEEIAGAWAERLHDIVYRFGGRTDKTIGTTSVALWIGSDARLLAERALRAALEIQMLAQSPRAISPLLDSSKILWKPQFVLASGNGLSGAIGGASGDEGFAMVGDPVNLAFRLREAAVGRNETLLMEEHTAKLVEAAFPLRFVDKSVQDEQGRTGLLYSIE